MRPCHRRRFGSAVEVSHLHLTLTIDDGLCPFFHAERALLNHSRSVKEAAQAVKAVLTDLYPGVWVGMIYVTHTFGRDLGFKPQVHHVTPAPTAGAV